VRGGENMPEIKVYFAPDGRITIIGPKSVYPDTGTIERLTEIIRELKKSSSANGSSRKSSTEEEQRKQRSTVCDT